MNQEFDQVIDGAVAKVFSTMLSLPIQPTSELMPWSNPDHLVAGSVGFTGTFSGILYFCMEAPFACRIAGKLLDMPPDEVETGGLLVDATGELTNMMAGQLKTLLCDHGITCALTVPSVIQGSFTVRSRPDTRRITRPFLSGTDIFQVELLIRLQSN
jgi:CheY-specific phosphatase CheX